AAAQLPGGACGRPRTGTSGFGTGNLPARRRSPPAEFPAEIVAPCQRDDWPTGHVAHDIHPDETTVQARVKQPERDAGSRNGGRLVGEDRLDLAALRGENRRLREDLEILKRATVILATATR